jgi:glycosyltransferase involved in cell wall biosynthesis
MLSIIIPTFNSMNNKKNSIKLTLMSIEMQKFNFNSMEVVIVDNGSSDNTIAYLNQVIRQSVFSFPVKIFHCSDTGNRSKARNIGVKNASGDQLLFLDDDTLMLRPDTLKKVTKLVRPNTFVCGAKRYWTKINWPMCEMEKYLIKRKCKKIMSMCHLPSGISRETGYRDLQEYSFIANFGLMIREDFNLMKGFDEVDFPRRREDRDLMYRLLLNDFKFINLFTHTSVLHLNHPMIASQFDERLYYHNKFRNKEIKYGYYFCANHLFGLIESDNNNADILQPVSNNNNNLFIANTTGMQYQNNS